jgi:hypothetical protein
VDTPSIDFGQEMKTVGLRAEPRPNGFDRFEWERFRFYQMARSMVGTDLTPNQAADLFDGNVPPQALTIHQRSRSAGEHPGGLKPADNLVWLVMARAETKEEPLAAPVEERLTASDLQRAVEAYNPAFREAKVIIGRDGPSHFSGRFAPPLGKIRAVEFDGHFVWGLVEHDNFELFWNVSRGAGARSIWVRPNSELEGKPPYIDHLALLWHEWPVQPNLPSLDQWLPSADSERPLEGFARAVSVATELLEDDSMKTTNTETNTDQAPGWFRSFADDLKSLLTASPQPKEEPKTETPEPKVRADGAPDLEAIVRAALEPIVATQKTLSERLEAESKARADASTAALHARIDSVLDGMVQTFRATPADADNWRTNLKAEGLPVSHVEQTLAMLQGAAPRSDLSRSVVVDLGESGGRHAASVDPRMIASPDGVYRANPEAVQKLAAVKAIARSRSGGDAEKEARIVTQILMHGDDELGAGAN